MSDTTSPITEQLRNWSGSKSGAFEVLLELVYQELRKISHNLLKGEGAISFQTTDLVHQIFVDLENKGEVNWQDRHHFYSVAAIAMRRVLVHDARHRNALKRGGKEHDLHVDEELHLVSSEFSAEDLLLFNDLLDGLSRQNETMARMVELRVFGGFTIPEVAEILMISEATIKRKWTFARAWIYKQTRESN